jgi:hypothetical protein
MYNILTVREIGCSCGSAVKTTVCRDVCHVCMLVDRCKCSGGIWLLHLSFVLKMEAAHSSGCGYLSVKVHGVWVLSYTARVVLHVTVCLVDSVGVAS